MRRLVSLALATMLVLSSVATADAATVKRTWTARVGKDAVNGTARMQAYTDGTGRLNLQLRKLRANTAYGLQIRAGTCANLGTVRATLFAATTTATGSIDTFRTIPEAKMNAIWTAARAGSIAIRIGSGSLAKCASLKFVVATRIVISKLSINLAVIRGPSGYPPCNVAMYMKELAQPREPGVTLIYAHARRGMFLPLLSRSKVNNGASLIGMKVKVYTSDSRVSTYQIIQVRRHVRSIQSAFGVTGERLWMYTSEGPNSSYPKLVVVAKRLSTTTTTYTASHPKARPVRC
ncbi:MAG: hypothetical protein ACSLFN_06530 [Candidatus Limnocylindrales bacterium]